MIALLLLAALVLTVLLVGITNYNRLLRSRQMALEGLGRIDLQLKRRADLIANLAETVKGCPDPERRVIEEVTALRNQSLGAGSVAAKGQVEAQLTQALRALLAVAEAHPDLKASQNFLTLQKDLAGVEEQLQLARRYYNGAVRHLNILVDSFPSNIVARLFGFAPMEYFELEEPRDRALPQMSLG